MQGRDVTEYDWDNRNVEIRGKEQLNECTNIEAGCCCVFQLLNRMKTNHSDILKACINRYMDVAFFADARRLVVDQGAAAALFAMACSGGPCTRARHWVDLGEPCVVVAVSGGSAGIIRGHIVNAFAARGGAAGGWGRVGNLGGHVRLSL